jgi:glycosyltransferase involved in cell wall biosynthesis
VFPAVPAVSVIIPVFNRTRLLQASLESVFAQSFTDFEVIVVDDGSAEDVRSACRALEHPKVRYIRQANQGPGAARNTGLAAALGEYISFLDSDDMLLPQNLEWLHSALVSHPSAGIAHGWATTVDHAGIEAQWTKPRLYGRAYRQYLVANPNLMGTLLARRTCFAEGCTFDPSLPLFEDWDLWLRLSFHHDFTCVPQRVARVVFQPVQRTTSQPAHVVGQTARRIYAKLQTDAVAAPLVRPLARQLEANVHVMVGHQLRLFERNLPEARREFVRALRYAPNYRPAQVGLFEALVGLRVTGWLRRARSTLYART